MSTTKIQDSVVGNLDASKLTGTMGSDIFPSVLPAVDGSALTGIASGGGGKVLQTEHFMTSGQLGNSTAGTYMATNLSDTITPSSVNSKIFINVNVCFHCSQEDKRMKASIFRGSGVGGHDLASTRIMGAPWDYGLAYWKGQKWNGGNRTATLAMSALDEPATTGPQTYTVGWFNIDSGLTSYYSINNGSNSIILMEIAA